MQQAAERIGTGVRSVRDASPDYWGRLIIERHSAQPILSKMDYLLNSPDDRNGILAVRRPLHDTVVC